MNYKECLKDRNDEVRERFYLARERILEISEGESSDMAETLQKYFRKTAYLLVTCQELYRNVE